jgi:predicted DNA-binding transcriptional regulator AlpA
MTPTIPQEGFVRLKQVLQIVPFGKTKWWNGVKTREFPQPVKHGRCTLWRVEDIRKLIDEIGNPNGQAL